MPASLHFCRDSYRITKYYSKYLFAVLVTVAQVIIAIAIAVKPDCCLSVALRVVPAVVRE